MIRSGQSIENPVTGEALIFHMRPAGQFEQLIETMFNLAADGKTSKKGMPNPLRPAVIARHHFDDVRLPMIPHVLQRLALGMGAPLGKAFGYREAYEAA